MYFTYIDSMQSRKDLRIIRLFSTKNNNSCLKKTVHARSIEKVKKRNMIKDVMKCYAAFGK